MGRPSRSAAERLEENARLLRAKVDAGSPDIVRTTLVGGAISGPRNKYPLPRIGDRQGTLTVMGYVVGPRGGVENIIVKCGCGRSDEYTINRRSFRDKRSTRCDLCAKEASHSKQWNKYKSAMPDQRHRGRLLDRLAAAISRCHNPNAKSYRNYGARGIYVCDEWRNDRTAFLKHVKTLDGWDDPGLDIDRIDNLKGYEPGNIRFVPAMQNTRNRRSLYEIENENLALKREIDDLRSRLRRAEEQIHRLVRLRPCDCA